MPQLGGARAPYSLRSISFPLPTLAALSGRASLGGPRETALGCLLVGRLILDAAASPPLASEARKGRAQHARHWLGAATLAGPVRAALSRAVDASTGDRRQAMSESLETVIAVTANDLDQAARLELVKLAQALAE